MRRGLVVGRFKPSRQGGWEGEIQTLVFQRPLRLVPNEDHSHANAPAFHVVSEWQNIGCAWERRTRTEPYRAYWRVRIEDPFFPLEALLFPEADEETARLVLPASHERGRGWPGEEHHE